MSRAASFHFLLCFLGKSADSFVIPSSQITPAPLPCLACHFLPEGLCQSVLAALPALRPLARRSSSRKKKPGGESPPQKTGWLARGPGGPDPIRQPLKLRGRGRNKGRAPGSSRGPKDEFCLWVRAPLSARRFKTRPEMSSSCRAQTYLPRCLAQGTARGGEGDASAAPF